MKLVGYARVSTVKQVEGTSLTTQKEAIESYCKLKGHELVFLFVEEGKSGKKDSYRPQYDNLRKRVFEDDNVEGVIVSSLSRFGRSLGEVVGFEQNLRKVSKVFISIKENFDLTTKEGRMMFNIVATINEYERELITERMEEGRLWANEHGSKSGKPCHRPPKEIDWNFVEAMRKENLSWGSVAKAISFNPKDRISKQALIMRAKQRGMKI